MRLTVSCPEFLERSLKGNRIGQMWCAAYHYKLRGSEHTVSASIFVVFTYLPLFMIVNVRFT